ncbi:hypothetical protein KAR48_05300 [bacterium]|nr:hypothetical protein [bacterium]
MNKKVMLMKILKFNSFVVILFFVCISCQESYSQHRTLYDELKSLSGVYVKKIETLKGFNESYELAIVQPIDHKNLTGPKFTQKVFLSHAGFNKPIVFETHGYDVPWHKKRELSNLLNANQIIVEHRYFGHSKPKPLEWKHLTTWQAASDHHRIIELLKTIYNRKWVSTGKSKGGMAALFHKYYYPADVQASVVYVAPIIIGLKDNRIPEHINVLCGETTKERMMGFQINCLKNREAILKIASSANFSTKRLKYNETLFYQQAIELGFYGYNSEHLTPFLEKVTEINPSVFAPKSANELVFDAKLMPKILEFLQTKANNIIYLYGENDIWTAGKVNPKESINSIQIIAKGLGHKFKIKDLSKENMNIAENSLIKWLGINMPTDQYSRVD